MQIATLTLIHSLQVSATPNSNVYEGLCLVLAQSDNLGPIRESYLGCMSGLHVPVVLCQYEKAAFY